MKSVIAPENRPRVYEAILIALLGLGTLALGLYHLTAYPAPWFDERWYLHIARNLARYGQYAVLSSEGFRYDDTALAVAPTLYLPIALAFRLVGVGLLPARLVMVLYLLATVAALYLTARRLYGYPVAAAAAYLFLLQAEDDPFTATLYLGRQAMGEIPALLFFLLGTLAFLKAMRTTAPSDVARNRRLPPSAVVAGLLFGLAMATKLQYVFFIPPALLLTALVAHLWLRRPLWGPTLLALAVGLVTLAAWYGCLGLLVGPENLAAILRGLSAASSPQVRVFSLSAIAQGAKFLLRSKFLVFGLPALLYGVILALRRDRRDVATLFLGAFILTGLGWYVVASIGWPRYTYPFLAVGNLFIAQLLYDLGDGFRLQPRPTPSDFAATPSAAAGGGGGVRPLRAMAVLLLLLFLPLAGFRTIARDILSPPDSGYEAFTRAVQETVPPGKVIETWEWELTVVDEVHRYHLPPTPLLNDLIARVYFGASASPDDYPFLAFDPDYIAVGRFARWTGLYPPSVLDACCRRVIAVGEYELFIVAQD